MHAYLYDQDMTVGASTDGIPRAYHPGVGGVIIGGQGFCHSGFAQVSGYHALILQLY